MIDELRFYRIAPGSLDDYLAHAGKVALPFRGDRYGKLLGFWYGEIGAVNSVYNLWRHTDLNAREALRAELATQDVWRKEYLPHSQPLMRDQVVRVMRPVLPLAAPATAGNIYELRFYRTPAGKAQALADALRSEQPGGDTLGLWTTFLGYVNEVVELRAYADARARLAQSLRAGAWRAFLEKHAALIDAIDSTLLLPADCSPLK